MTDNLQSNVLTVATDGTIAAELSGGVLVPVTQADPPAEANAITLVRPDASIAGRLFLDELTTSIPAQMVLEADGISGLSSSVEARASRPGPVSASAVLIDSDDRSSFLQLLSAQQLQLAFGEAQITAGAGAGFTVAHGLGRLPKWWTAFAIGWAGFLYGGNPDATNLNLNASVALAGNFLVWAAIG